MDFWVLNNCRKIAIGRLLTWGFVTAIILAVGVGIGLSNVRYIQNFFDGPYQMSENDLLGIRDIETAPRIFVTISGSRTVDTGVQEITVEQQNGTEVSKRVSSEYFALLVGHHWLIVKTDVGVQTSIEGTLESMTSDLYGKVFTSGDERQAAVQFYPFYVDATGLGYQWPSGRRFVVSTFRYYGICMILGGVVFLAIYSYVIRHEGGQALLWLQDPMTHPVMQRIQKWGGPQSVSTDIERELQLHAAFKHGRFTFTEKYLVQKSLFRFNIFRFEDLVWAYKQITQRRVYGFIPGGKSYHVIFIFYGDTAQITISEKNVEKALLFASNKAPWAVIGYTPELSDFFKKNSQDFCAAVEVRRQATRK